MVSYTSLKTSVFEFSSNQSTEVLLFSVWYWRSARGWKPRAPDAETIVGHWAGEQMDWSGEPLGIGASSATSTLTEGLFELQTMRIF